MILKETIISNFKGVSLGVALRKYIWNKGNETAEIRMKYVTALIDMDYDHAQNMLLKIFMTMKKEGIGIDYESFYEDMDGWDHPEKEIRRSIAMTVYQTYHGGKREGAGRPPKGDSPKVAFPVSRVAADVADIVRQQDNKTEFVESAIRFYHQSKQE